MPKSEPDPKAEMRAMLATLEIQAAEAAQLAMLVERGLKAETYAAYHEFRSKIGEFRALVSLLDARLGGLDDQRAGDLREQFQRLDQLVLTMVVRAAKSFFVILAESKVFPLGAHDLFLPELASLDEAEERLRRPDYAAAVGPSVLHDLDEARERLKLVLNRLPALPDFSGLPTLPKELEHRPTREDYYYRG
ncbi:MAG: hypothetical protein GC191_04435 [Azospirillum sp.]|nr:hypothetical protein [Azospirillum sp.]